MLHLHLFFFLFLLSPLIQSDPLIPEERFTSIIAHEQTLINLSSETKEIYYKFENTNKDTEIAITFAVANAYTVNGYLFKSLSDIQTDEQGEYKGYHFSSLITEKLMRIPPTHLDEQGDVHNFIYIIIKEKLNYFYNDYITIFNEVDPVPLNSNEPYGIKEFMSTEKMTFTFTQGEDETVELIIQSENKTALSSITVINAETGDTEFTTQSSDATIKIECKTKIINYELTVSTTIDPVQSEEDKAKENEVATNTEGNRKTVVLYKYLNRVVNIVSGGHEETYFISNRKLYYYVDLSNYDYNEESTLSGYLDFKATQNEMLDSFYAKIVSIEDITDEALLPLFPQQGSSSEFKYHQVKNSDTYYEMHFYINKTKEIDKHLLLLVYVNLLSFEDFYPSRKMSLALSEQMAIRNLDDIEMDSSLIHIKSHIPYYIKFITSGEEKEDLNERGSYIVYASKERVISIFNGNLFDHSTGEDNAQVNNEQGYVISKVNIVKDRQYIIRGYGAEQKIKLIGESTLSNVKYLSGVRPEMTVSTMFSTCYRPSYIIGNYNEVIKSYLRSEPLFGDFDIYYRSKIPEDLNLGILPKSDEFLITDKTKAIELSDTIEIIGITCKIPGYINTNFIGGEVPTKLQDNSNVNIYGKQNESKEIKFPVSELQNDTVNYHGQITTIQDTRVSILINSEQYYIDKDNHIITIKLNQIPIETGLAVGGEAEDNTVVSITLISNDTLFNKKEITNEETSLNGQNILFFFPDNVNYYEGTIVLTGMNSNFYYCFGYTTDDEFVPLPQNSGNSNYVEYLNLKDGAFSITLTNPKDKYSTLPVSTKYYLSMSFENNQSGTAKNSLKEKQTIPAGTPTQFGIISSLKTPLNNSTYLIEKQHENKDKNVLIIAHICGESPTAGTVGYYGTVYNELNFINNYSVMEIKNYGTDMQINGIFDEEERKKEPYHGIIVNYYYKDSTKAFDENIVLQYNNYKSKNITYQKDKSIFSWDLNANATKYEIYIMHNNEDNKKLINNDCYLLKIKEEFHNKKGLGGNEELDTDSTNYVNVVEIKGNNFEFKESGDHVVNIVAIYNNEISFRFVYTGIEVTISGESDANPSKLLRNGLISLISVAVIAGIVIIIYCVRRKRKDKLNIVDVTQPLVQVRISDE